MASGSTILFIHIASILRTHFAHSANISATLNPSQTTDNGATVRSTSGQVTVKNNQWTVESVTNQIGYDWGISFTSDQWSMSDHLSVFTLTIFSNSATDVDGVDRDLVVTFSQDDTRYFTLLLSFDNRNGNQIYPDCDTQTTPNQSFVYGNAAQLLSTNNGEARDEKLNQGEAFDGMSANVEPKSCCNKPPFILTLTNNVTANWMKFEYTDQSVFPWTQGCGFEAFAAGSPLDIYISADDMEESVNITSFEISLYPATASQSSDKDGADPLTVILVPLGCAVCICMAITIFYIARKKKKLNDMDQTELHMITIAKNDNTAGNGNTTVIRGEAKPIHVATTKGKKDDKALKRQHEEIRAWISDRVRLPQYFEAFVSNGFDDSMQFVQAIQDTEELQEIGITDCNHQELILKAIRNFQAADAVAYAADDNDDEEERKKQEVADWLSEVVGLKQYVDVFVEHGFDDMETVKEIQEQHLDAMSIKMGHKMKLMKYIEQVKTGDIHVNEGDAVTAEGAN